MADLDLLAKVEAMRQASKAKAEENRRAMPEVAAIVDEFKEVFGADQITVTYAEENGRVVGRKSTDVGYPASKMWLNPTEPEPAAPARVQARRR